MMDNPQLSSCAAAAINEEMLLKVICNYPAIYDPQRKGYSNRQMTDRAWENVALSVRFSVEACKKKWKALREKYHREKEKLAALSRSGMEYVPVPQWPLMSFFTYMFENRKPRETSSSALLETNHTTLSIPTTDSEETDQENFTYSEVDTSTQFVCEGQEEFPQSSTSTAKSLKRGYIENMTCSDQSVRVSQGGKGKMRKIDSMDPVLGVLGDISQAVKNVSKSEPSKLYNFAQYILSELQDLPKAVSEEFVDETLIRVLQLKRRHRQHQ